MWHQTLIQAFKIKELRDKIFFVLGAFVIFRLMANIPIIGIDPSQLKQFFGEFGIFQLLGAFTGGSLDRFSLVMLGLGPYITAIIIFQLMTMIFPALERMYKEEGEIGRAKFNQYARIATVPLAMLQGWAMISLLSGPSAGILHFNSPLEMFSALLMITAGAMLLMWVGELVTEKGIGNGVSLLIFAGIMADFPRNLRQMIEAYDPSMAPGYIAFFAMAIAMVAAVVLVNEARRNIPVSYAKRVRGTKMAGGTSTYLPLSVNPAGVIPIIFALSVLVFPAMVAKFFESAGGWVGNFAGAVVSLFSIDSVFYMVSYFILVVMFTYFYTAVTFNPKQISGNLQKMGGFIPGIRPGQPTADFLRYILNRVLLFGAVFLGLIAVMPQIIGPLTGVNAFSFLIGGTSLLIAVSVILETVRQIRAQLQMREYETF
jgi:preprotein translocase subunit SecY